MYILFSFPGLQLFCHVIKCWYEVNSENNRFKVHIIQWLACRRILLHNVTALLLTTQWMLHSHSLGTADFRDRLHIWILYIVYRIQYILVQAVVGGLEGEKGWRNPPISLSPAHSRHITTNDISSWLTIPWDNEMRFKQNKKGKQWYSWIVTNYCLHIILNEIIWSKRKQYFI